MQTRSGDENSVRLSVKRVDRDKTKEKCVQISIPYERTFSLVLWQEQRLMGGDPFYLKFWVNRPPLERNRRFWTDNRASAVTPSEKSSININMKSPTLFPVTLRWSLYVAPKSPEWGSKKQNGRFFL